MEYSKKTLATYAEIIHKYEQAILDLTVNKIDPVEVAKRWGSYGASSQCLLCVATIDHWKTAEDYFDPENQLSDMKFCSPCPLNGKPETDDTLPCVTVSMHKLGHALAKVRGCTATTGVKRNCLRIALKNRLRWLIKQAESNDIYLFTR